MGVIENTAFLWKTGEQLSLLVETTEQTVTTVDGGEEVSEDQGKDGHELHDDVKSGTGGILEGVTDGITDNSSLVDFRALAFDDAVNLDLALLDVLLGVIPSATSVGGGDSQLDGRGDGTGKKTRDTSVAEEDTSEDRGHHDEDGGKDHFLEGGLGGDVNASGVVGLDTGLALEEVWILVELSLDFLDHFVGGETDGLHGHGGEPVGDHGTDEKEREDNRVEERDLVGGASGTVDVGTEEGKTNEASRSDGETLADGGSGVTSGVEGVSDVADFGGKLGHLGDTTGVVTHGAVHINGKAGGEVGKHTEGSKSHTEHVEEHERHPHDDGEKSDGDDGGLVTEGKTVDDVGGGTGLARLSDLAGGGVGVRGEVLSDETDEATSPETGAHTAPGHDGGTRKRKARDGGDVEVAAEGPGGNEVHGDGDEQGGDGKLPLQDGLDILFLSHGGDVGGKEGSHKAHDDTSGGNEERVHELKEGGVGELITESHSGGNDNQGSARGLTERAEEIGSHTGDVTNIVTDVVSDGGGVARIVFGEAVDNLTSEISTDIGGLGVDTTTDATEHSNGRTTETETSDDLEEGLGIGFDGELQADELNEDVKAEEGETAKGVTHDATSAEGGVEGVSPLIDTHSRDGGTSVGVHSDLHANVASEDGSATTDSEGDGGEATNHGVPDLIRTLNLEVGSKDTDEDTKEQDENAAHTIFGAEERVGTIADGIVDLSNATHFVHQHEGILDAGASSSLISELNLRDEIELEEGEENADNAANDDKSRCLRIRTHSRK